MGTILETANGNGLLCTSRSGGGTGNLAAAVPLVQLQSGDSGTVLRLDGGEDFRCKMLSLGIIPGKTITVFSGEKHCPYILRVDESRVMIDRRTLERIFVQTGTIQKRGGN